MPQTPTTTASALSTGPLAADKRHVFVYGTLRRGECNDINRLHPAARFVGEAQVPAALYHLGDYPGAVLGGPVFVQGEVYAIEPELEHQLDAVEGIAGSPQDEYFKREIDVQLASTTVRCLVYELNPAGLDSRERIEGGDWVHFRTRSDRTAFS